MFNLFLIIYSNKFNLYIYIISLRISIIYVYVCVNACVPIFSDPILVLLLFWICHLASHYFDQLFFWQYFLVSFFIVIFI